MKATVPTEGKAIVALVRNTSWPRVHVAFEEGTHAQSLHDVLSDYLSPFKKPRHITICRNPLATLSIRRYITGTMAQRPIVAISVTAVVMTLLLGCPRKPHDTAGAKPVAKTSASTAAQQCGRVKWFNDAKGFGFITVNTGEDIFLHFSAIAEPGTRSFSAGEMVSFQVVKTPRGLEAAHVQRDANCKGSGLRDAVENRKP